MTNFLYEILFVRSSFPFHNFRTQSARFHKPYNLHHFAKMIMGITCHKFCGISVGTQLVKWVLIAPSLCLLDRVILFIYDLYDINASLLPQIDCEPLTLFCHCNVAEIQFRELLRKFQRNPNKETPKNQ